MSQQKKPLIIIGSGGHAKVVINVARVLEWPILGITEANQEKINKDFLGISVIGLDDKVFNYSPEEVQLVNAIGSIKSSLKRKVIFDTFKAKGYQFATLVHPSAIIAQRVEIDEGAQIMAGAIIQPDACIGSNSIINTGAIIEHDCKISKHVHIAPGVVISGNVIVGANTHIGVGAKIIQSVKIGTSCTVAAGAVVTKNVEDDSLVMGVPAKTIR
ncbi:acetyltransferase [Heliorestis acidaminivorans]|uniref:Acetyltransferase n=1 Tax=Heliorestis acidaminivorans TaxID=553427 RepID=A0A6I0F123_9FIRM|nr:acetyltransferase [Heliorestis acidaminivorans]KAB2953621.1 acetyltransferase [Heliorestis acidaminivorans]